MLIALYSKIAREDIALIRKEIKDYGIYNDVSGMKLFRHKIINSDIPIHVHPARKLLAGKVFASIYDKLIEAQNKLAQGTDGYEKKITCSPSLVSRISKLNNPTQEHINIVLGKKRATRFGKAFFKILKNHQ